MAITDRAQSMLTRPRVALASALRHRIAGSEFEEAHREIWHTPGPRWFSSEDPIWIVHADASMFIGGIRALLLQSLHPVAMFGVSEHSGFRGDPWGRLHRTSKFLATTTYGTISDAERSIAIVRAIHSRVTGVLPDGQPYAASDPALLTWIHLAEIDSFLTSYRVFGSGRLSADQADGYVRQTGSVAERLGVLNPPQTVAELDQAMSDYRPLLRISQPARETTELLLHDPPLSGVERVGYRVLSAGAISLLPPWARAELRLPTLPVADRTVVRPVARSALLTLRWALAGV